MDEPKSYLTAEGIQKLREELDISENAGYDEAKNTQAFVEGRILTLRNILSSAVVINENGRKDTVDIGCKVTIRDVEYGDEETYAIVGSTEVDPGNGRISFKSPIGRALMGHRVSEFVAVQTPGGSAEFEIVKIE